MNLHKSKIDWCTHTWNPVTGCRHGCEYCYARRFIARFKPHQCEWPEDDYKERLNEPYQRPEHALTISTKPTRLVDSGTGEYIRSTPYPVGFEPTFHEYKLDHPKKRFIPSRVFVVSMGDLFGDWVPDSWIETIFSSCKEAPQHTYLFLTKNPDRYCKLANAGKLPKEDNFWYGTTITHKGDTFFGGGIGFNTFLSIEPLMEDLQAGIGSFGGVRWIIVGAMTGPGSKGRQPRREWIENIVETAKLTQAAVFMKDNLADVWGPELLREHPVGMVWPEEEADGADES